MPESATLFAQPGLGTGVMIVAAIVLGIMGLVLLVVAMRYGAIWFQAYMSGAHVSMFSLIGMTFRRVDARVIVESRIMALQAGLDRTITTRKLEAHYLAGGNVPYVIRAIIAAHRADIPLDFDRAAAIDLAGRNVLEAVQTSVHPKVIDCPDPRRGGRVLSAIAKNGVQLKVRARVTVRTNLDQLIGGATEDTVIARVGEGIITACGSASSHLEVMENPHTISKRVLERGLDAQTAFEIVSIDIADIDVGENIGARLQADQAEADVRVARAKAEERRAFAVAHEQEMKALVAENRARVVLAEADVPMAMATSFRRGIMHSRKVKPGERSGNGSAAPKPSAVVEAVTEAPAPPEVPSSFDPGETLEHPGSQSAAAQTDATPVSEPESAAQPDANDEPAGIYDAVLDAMCCIVAADRQVSPEETAKVQALRARAKAP